MNEQFFGPVLLERSAANLSVNDFLWALSEPRQQNSFDSSDGGKKNVFIYI